MNLQKSFIAILVIFILALVFALQNTQVITINLWRWHFGASLALVLVSSFALGALLSFLFSLPWRIKNQKQINTKDERIEDLENKIVALDPKEKLNPRK